MTSMVIFHYSPIIGPIPTGSKDLLFTCTHLDKLQLWLYIKNQYCQLSKIDQYIHQVIKNQEVLTVSEIKENKYKVIYNKKKGIVSKTWAKKGDKLYVYNPENLVIKGEAVVNSFENGYLTLTEDSYNLSVGDMITNCAYMPEVKIVNCTVHKCVGQFKIKSCVKALVKNCKFYSEGRGVNVSTFIPTLEGGPVQNVIIEENEFNYSLKHAPIFVGFIKDFSEYTNDYTRKDVPIIKNVTIRNNVFNKISCDELMRIACCDGALIENNKYVDCTAQKIAIYNSKNVTIK